VSGVVSVARLAPNRSLRRVPSLTSQIARPSASPALPCRLEVDLLLGTWATQNVSSLNEVELKQFEQLLNQETIDIYNFMTGKDALPAALQNPLMARIQQWCNNHPLGRADPKAYANIKKSMSN
jgi:succinate dehydrogenase flavin-adding protein (antitoxin of CptAB toxin-antitoxin module)